MLMTPPLFHTLIFGCSCPARSPTLGSHISISRYAQTPRQSWQARQGQCQWENKHSRWTLKHSRYFTRNRAIAGRTARCCCIISVLIEELQRHHAVIIATATFLPRDASAQRGYEIAFVCLSVRLCVRNDQVPYSHRLEFFENNFTAK